MLSLLHPGAMLAVAQQSSGPVFPQASIQHIQLLMSPRHAEDLHRGFFYTKIKPRIIWVIKTMKNKKHMQSASTGQTKPIELTSVNTILKGANAFIILSAILQYLFSCISL